jgi:hypothetical protein
VERDPVQAVVVVVTSMSVAHELYRLTGDRYPLTIRVEWCDPMETCSGTIVLPAAAADGLHVGAQLDLHLYPVLAAGGHVDPGSTVTIGEGL